MDLDEKNIILKRENKITRDSGSKANNLIASLKEFDELADWILNSSYRKSFEKKEVVGKDDDGRPIYETVVEKGDIMACFMLGADLGLSPMGSISLGKELTSKSYLSVQRGRSLGLDPMTSMSKIYAFENSAGNIVTQLDTSIITKCILDSCDYVGYIRDYEYTKLYYNLEDDSYVGHHHLICDKDSKVKPQFFIYNVNYTQPEEVKLAAEANKTIIIAKGSTFVTSIRLVRTARGIDQIFHYSIQDAIDAGLHKGFHSSNKDQKGNPVYITGRANWNNHPATMLRNRVNSISGRVVVADKIQGGYSPEEIQEILDIDSETLSNYSEE